MSILAGIFRRFWPGYRVRFRQDIPAAHRRAAEAILRCRTAQTGMVYYRCGDCGELGMTGILHTWDAGSALC